MRIQTLQITVGVVAAIAFVVAFISAGVALVSFAFALVGAAALGWVTYSIAKRMLSQRRSRDVTLS